MNCLVGTSRCRPRKALLTIPAKQPKHSKDVVPPKCQSLSVSKWRGPHFHIPVCHRSVSPFLRVQESSATGVCDVERVSDFHVCRTTQPCTCHSVWRQSCWLFFSLLRIIVLNEIEAVVALSVCTLPTFCQLRTYRIYQATRKLISIQEVAKSFV